METTHVIGARPAAAPQLHLVVPGETLTGIAHAFHTTVANLVRLNHIPLPDGLTAGQVLRIR